MKLTPAVIAALSWVIGVGLAIAGIGVLYGLGWALVAGAVPCLTLAAVLTRGVILA